MKIDKSRIQSCVDHINTAVDVDPWAKELVAEMGKEILKAQLSKEDATSDCISRQAALELGDNLRDDLPDDEQIAAAVMAHNEGIIEYQTKLSLLPSVQPDVPDTNVGDMISRQGAMDAFGLSEKTRKYGGDHSGYDTRMLYEIQDVLEELPSVQPELCEDAVSREAVSKWLKQYGQDVLHGKYKFSLMYIWKNLIDLPSVQPTYTEAQLQKMQDMHQAEIDKAFDLGREDARAEIICCNECKHCRKGRRTDGEIIPE